MMTMIFLAGGTTAYSKGGSGHGGHSGGHAGGFTQITLEATQEAARLTLRTTANIANIMKATLAITVTSGIFTISITSFITGSEGDYTA